jgi:UDP-N-acetylglucosamine--N-acetylmuramyl-(pentapeptide) pyrophosphoryl-undecaprenol N-acetylglucosamine transferase
VKLITALFQSFIHIRRFRPDVVVGTGGYVCGPPAYMATLLRIPVVLQEQNSYPGVTTRLLAHRVTRVYLAIERARRFLRRQDNTVISGNPVRIVVGTVTRAEAAKRLDWMHAENALWAAARVRHLLILQCLVPCGI